MTEQIRFANAAGAEDAARQHRRERIDDVGEFRAAGNADIAQPRHGEVFLRRANGEPLLVEMADDVREVAALIRRLRRLGET